MLTEGGVEVEIADDLVNDLCIFWWNEGWCQNGKKMSQELQDLELWVCELIYAVRIYLLWYR